MYATITPHALKQTINNDNAAALREYHQSLWLYWITAPLCFTIGRNVTRAPPSSGRTSGRWQPDLDVHLLKTLSFGVICAIY